MCCVLYNFLYVKTKGKKKILFLIYFRKLLRGNLKHLRGENLTEDICYVFLSTGINEATLHFREITIFYAIFDWLWDGFSRIICCQFNQLRSIISSPADFPTLNAFNIFLTSYSDIGNRDKVEFWGVLTLFFVSLSMWCPS